MTLTIRELLLQAIQFLKDNGVENSILDAQIILSYVLNVDKLYLIVHGDSRLDKETITKFNELLYRRAEGMPIQYITGIQEFMSLSFAVTEDVLIPRADTETLVEHVITHYFEYAKHQRIMAMDICTGSGCIAISLAYYLKNINIWAIDISLKALAVAEKNAITHRVNENIYFIHHNILKGFPQIEKDGLLDLIVSNPPYIPSAVIKTLQKEVRDYEPQRALDGGLDGLLFYPVIIDEAAKNLKPGGLLALEIGYDQSGDVMSFMQRSSCFDQIHTVSDLAGINRVVIAQKSNHSKV